MSMCQIGFTFVYVSVSVMNHVRVCQCVSVDVLQIVGVSVCDRVSDRGLSRL